MRNRYSDHSLHLNPADTSIQTCIHSLQHAIYSTHEINITSGDISVKMSPVMTFSHRRHFSLSALQLVNVKLVLSPSSPSQPSWRINSPHMNSFIFSMSFHSNHNKKYHQCWHFSKKVTSRDIFTQKTFQPLCFARMNAKPILRSSLHLNPADTSIHTCILSLQACYSFNHNWNITSGNISVKMSPVVTFLHWRHFSRFCFAIVNAKPIVRFIPPSQSSWHIHSRKHTFTSASYSFNHNRNISKWWHFSKNVTSHDIFTQNDISAFLLYNNQCKTDTQIIPPSQSSWHIHSHMHSFTSACDSFNRIRNITKWWHFSKNVTSHDIFTQKTYQPFCFTIIICKTDTQIIPPSQSSWHIHSRKHTFTSASYSFNHNRNITSGDISVKMSHIVATFSHRRHFQPVLHCNKSMRKQILRSFLHLNPADTSIHTCIHSLQHAIHSIHNRNITSGDISVKMSPVIVTFSHRRHFSLFCFTIINAKPILRSSLHLNPADTSIHTCIHSLQHAIHSIRH